MYVIAKQYKSALVLSLFLQLGILALANFCFYDPKILFILCIPCLAYWIITPIIIYRRPTTPTKEDLVIVRAGYPVFILLMLLGFGIYNLLMKFMGKI